LYLCFVLDKINIICLLMKLDLIQPYVFVEISAWVNTWTTYHCHAFMFSLLLHYSLHFVLLAVIVKVNTITKKNERALRHPYQTRAKTQIMSEIKEVQEQMKADTEAMKDQMTSMMEAMLSMRQMMEDNVATVAATSAVTEADPTHPSSINQTSRPVPDIVG